LSSLFNFFHFPLFCCHRSFFLKKYIFHTCSLHIHLKMCVHVCVCACVWEREIVCVWVSVHVLEGCFSSYSFEFNPRWMSNYGLSVRPLPPCWKSSH
jgi:hypothetical protein